MSFILQFGGVVSRLPGSGPAKLCEVQMVPAAKLPKEKRDSNDLHLTHPDPQLSVIFPLKHCPL